jgi:hypothetical protein
VHFRKAFRQERIANGARERNIHCSAYMLVSEFSVSEAELPPAEAMWMNRYVRPCRYLLFELPHFCHCRSNSLLHNFDERKAWLDAGQYILWVPYAVATGNARHFVLY